MIQTRITHKAGSYCCSGLIECSIESWLPAYFHMDQYHILPVDVSLQSLYYEPNFESVTRIHIRPNTAERPKLLICEIVV